MVLGQESFAGELMDGLSAVLRPVRVTIEIGDLKAVDGQGRTAALWPLGGVRMEALGGGVFHLTHPSAPDALLSTSDALLVEKVAAAAGRGPSGSHERARGRLARILAYGAGVAAALVGIYLALPVIAAAIARRIPISVEEQISVQLAPLLAKARCQSPALEASVKSLVTRLETAHPTGYPVDLWVVDMQVVNAFALPGGKVVVTRGLLAKAEGPDEVAGVVAHELAHVAERHVMTQVVRASMLSFLWAATIGDFSGLFVVDPSVAHQIATRRFGRDEERAADRRAVVQLDRAGISRKGFAAFFDRIKDQTDVVPEILSTHPTSEDRMREIRAGAPTAGTTPALSDADWQALRGACGAEAKPAAPAAGAKQ
jgi:predicted Zn-dependent protease